MQIVSSSYMTIFYLISEAWSDINLAYLKL